MDSIKSTHNGVDAIDSPKEIPHAIVEEVRLDITRCATPAKAHIRSNSLLDPSPTIRYVNSTTRLANRATEEEAARASRRHTLRVIAGFITCFTTGWVDGGLYFQCFCMESGGADHI